MTTTKLAAMPNYCTPTYARHSGAARLDDTADNMHEVKLLLLHL